MEPALAVVPYVPRVTGANAGTNSHSDEGGLQEVAIRPPHSRCPLCLRDFDIGSLGGEAEGGSASDGATAAPLLLDSSYFRSLPLRQQTLTDIVPFAGQSKRRRTPGHVSPVPSSAADDDGDDDERRCLDDDDEALSETIDRTSGYYQQYFAELRCIGRGASGGVFLCRHVLDGISLGMFAVKKIPVGEDPAYLRRAIGEVQLLERIPRHPNIVEYHHTWFDYARLADFGPEVRCLFVLLEYATEGSLDGYVEAHGSGLSNATVWYFFLSALAGTAHLHANGVLHRDLKPQNLLLTQIDSKLPPRLFVSDFGTASLAGDANSGSSCRTGGTGTEDYMAPELFETDVSSTNLKFRHSEASDVWSLGLILHYMACDGQLPATLPGHSGAVVLNVEARSPVQRSPEMVALMRAMLQRDPSKRPSCAEILQSDFVVALRATLLSELKQHGTSASPSTTGSSLPTPMPLLLKYRATSAGHRRATAQGSASPPPAPPPDRPSVSDASMQTEPVRFYDD